MAFSLKTVSFLPSHKLQTSNRFLRFQSPKLVFVVDVAVKPLKAMASQVAVSPTSSVGLRETLTNLRSQGRVQIYELVCDVIALSDEHIYVAKVAFIPYITAGDPDLSTTAEALKLLDSCGSGIIEVGVPYSDPLADGPVIQAAATRALARGTNFNAVISMLKEVIPQISCPIALFTYFNPILKRGIEKFMVTIKDVGVHGLVVPDVPLEETETLRKEAVSSVGVTGARSSVSSRVQSMLQEIKEVLPLPFSFCKHNDVLVTTKPVAVGFGISKPEHVKQVAGWGADGVIVGSAIVKILGEAKTPGEGLKELETFIKSLKAVI
ncbi:hypothetical protein Sjap_006424 [Stephania japonica]|uniref:tryptophan synthase n=1 Tax=Stephania japonica TaxID=461633 RepID=A0AAP0K5S8_9MAGN